MILEYRTTRSAADASYAGLPRSAEWIAIANAIATAIAPSGRRGPWIEVSR